MLESSPCKDQRVPDSIQAPCGRSDPTLKHAGTVEVGWRTNARSVEVFIRDQGPRLLNSDNLFVPFFTTKHGGSGIGLILSRQIAEAHGGVLQLANRSDRTGCEAVLALPITYDGTGG
jgi:two-component system nitrogen regulation sensor histidine kinase NtrY